MNDRLSLVLALAATPLLGAGCAGAHEKTLPSGSGTILVDQSIDPSGGIPIEGEYSYVRIEKPGGEKLIERRLRYDAATKRSGAAIRLGPGSYRLVSYQRTCDGNCGYLDAPSTFCSGRFRISSDKGGKPLGAKVRVNFGSGCTISIAAAS